MVFMQASNRLLSLILYISLVWLLLVFVVSRTTLSARLYNAMIVTMTSTWYQAVLKDIAPDSVLLDVGIGTSGALLSNIGLVRKKNLRIFGIDVSAQYVKAAQEAIQRSSLDEDQVQVARHSIYDVPSIQSWLKENQQQQQVDVVYFSGSFSLLPDSLQALHSARQLVKPGATVYITQTYASSTSLIGRILKPMIKYLTTIDFGQLVTEDDVLQLLQESKLEIVTHKELLQTNALGLSPPAYFTKLRVPSNGEESTCMQNEVQ